MPVDSPVFARLCKEYVDFYFQERPTWATYRGYRRYDRELPSHSQHDLNRRRRERKRFARRLKSFEARKLSLDDRIDRELLLSALKLEDYEERVLASHKRDARHYLDFGLNALIEDDFLPRVKSARALLSRLREAPRLMAQARENLTCPLQDSTQSVIAAIPRLTAYLRGPLTGFVRTLRGKANRKLRADLLAARDQLLSELERFDKFLREEALPRATDDFAVGRRYYNMLLRHRHGLEIDCDELLATARKRVREVRRELRECARKIDPRRDWKELLDSSAQAHPEAGSLIATYRDEMSRARSFVRSRGIVGFPAREKLRVIPTPLHARSHVARWAIHLPPPFASQPLGTMWITPVPADASSERADKMLRQHSLPMISALAAHEGYPGHQLHFAIRQGLPRPLRKVLITTAFSEGWAIYSEELMWQLGFFTDPRVKLVSLQMELIRSAASVIDVLLHTKKMDVSRAVSYLVRACEMERSQAVGHVRMLCYQPTQQMSYLLGKVQILELLKDYKKLKGKDFCLRAFHDELLAHGTIPFKYVRHLMGIE